MDVGIICFGDWMENSWSVENWKDMSDERIVEFVCRVDDFGVSKEEIRGSLEVKRVGEYLIEVECGVVSEFGWMLFNMDEMRGLNGKFIKVLMNGYEVISKEDIKIEGSYNRGLDYWYDGVDEKYKNEVVCFDWGCSYFGLGIVN